MIAPAGVRDTREPTGHASRLLSSRGSDLPVEGRISWDVSTVRFEFPYAASVVLSRSVFISKEQTLGTVVFLQDGWGGVLLHPNTAKPRTWWAGRKV